MTEKINQLIDFLESDETHKAFTVICACIGALALAFIYGYSADEVKLGTLILMLPLGAIIGALLGQLIIVGCYIFVWGSVIALAAYIIYWILWLLGSIIYGLYNIVLWEN
ncbi:hypothetical protein KORDIASMS9_02831 [Kordia sp. SMS9]|uniref:hypothetical protein n=1 Tax=Kordia sp. SMS9 TaxID=2282170 RepID=UPI000E0CFF10|nr:hypothetical protein [Kordia sp. SMS9]AXG70591.1 hypothetical protein KORDIASMS9_02831 [Kordia sp. SMS9]